MVQGSPKRFLSSATAWRGFCADCGTQITFQYNDRPGSIDITLSSLDDPNTVLPQRHIFAADRLSWLSTEDGLPRHDAAPPPSGNDGD